MRTGRTLRYYTVTAIEAVNKTGLLRAEIDGLDHVSIMPIPETMLLSWRLSRAKLEKDPDAEAMIYTQILQIISVRSKGEK